MLLDKLLYGLEGKLGFPLANGRGHVPHATVVKLVSCGSNDESHGFESVSAFAEAVAPRLLRMVLDKIQSMRF